ncbi:MAG: BACON domain-containing carbohydrate-binding protein [Vicinamibacterales bacterium]
MNAPSASKCQVSLGNPPSPFPAAGLSGNLQVSTTRDCAWSVSGAPAWLTLTGPASGQGSADLAYRVASNPDPLVRRGTIAVNDAQVALEQEGTPCRYAVSPAEASVVVGGGSVAVRVDTGSAACTWTTVAQDSWLHAGAGTTGGAGGVTVRVDANTGAARRGTVVVAGQPLSVEQAGVPVTTPTPTPNPDPNPTPTSCSYVLDVSSVSVQAAGASGLVTVTTGASCTWRASSDASWLTVTGPATGTGSAAVAYAVAPNVLTAPRSATLTIGGKAVSVTQAGAVVVPPQPTACSYAIAPSTATVGPASTTLAVGVTTQPTCQWRVQQGDKWLDSSSSGTGSGSASVDVQRYKGNGQRVGTISIAGQTFTVTQTK